MTRAAEDVARRRLSPALLGHSYRTYAFGVALGELEELDVDREVLFAAALLHDVGLPTPTPQVDFTLASARAARDVAEQVGLSTAATDTLRTAITLHHSPGVTLAHGPVAYLLSAGAGLDVVGVRSWQLPPDLLAAVVAAHPRAGFKREFSAAFRTEADPGAGRPRPVPPPVRGVRPGHQDRPVRRLSPTVCLPQPRRGGGGNPVIRPGRPPAVAPTLNEYRTPLERTTLPEARPP